MIRLFLAVWLVLTADVAETKADDCMEILRVGSNDLSWVTFSNEVSESAKSAFCDERFLNSNGATSFGLDVLVPLDGVPFEFGANSTDERSLEARSRFCASADRSFSQSVSFSILKKITSPEAYSAYIQCRQIDQPSAESIGIRASTVSGNIVLLESWFSRRHAGQAYPKIESLHLMGIGDCVGQIQKGEQLVETRKKSFCTRQGDDAAVVMLTTEYETTHASLPARGKVGECTLVHSIPKINWVDTGECREGVVLTDSRHNMPPRHYDIIVEARNEDERLAGECRAPYCRPRPNHQNGCAFTQIVGENISPRRAVTNLMAGSHAQIWARGFRVQKKHIIYELKEGESVSLLAGRTFSIEVPDGEEVTARCIVHGNAISFNALALPAGYQSLLAPVGSPARGSGKTIMAYEVLAR